MKRLTMVALAATVACGDAPASTESGARLPTLRQVEPAGQAQPWAGLLHPIQLTTSPDGRVFVADNGDMTIKVFDADGTALDTIGRRGSGPGEFEAVQDLAVTRTAILVLDPRLRRIQIFDHDHGLSGTISGVAAAYFDAVGSEHLVVSGDPEWSMSPATLEGGAAPLAQITDLDGETVARIGERAPAANPFVDQIANFILPAGTADGNSVWVAYLNRPEVHLHPVNGEAPQVYTRSIPFDWATLPADFMPTMEMMGAPEERQRPPFDALSLGIATDTAGRAFVLTALARVGAEGEYPRIGVDVLIPADTTIVRYLVPGQATHIAVSPDGNRIYLLNEATATLGIFTRGT